MISSKPTAAMLLLLGACATHSEDGAMEPAYLVAIDPPVGVPLWEGLQKPVAVRVDAEGHVLVADEGDSKIRIFDADGARLREVGARGSGPGEFTEIKDMVPGRGVIRVFDGVPGRFHLISTEGVYLGTNSIEGVGDEILGSLGDSSVIVASSARWSLPARAGAPAWPLARVIDGHGRAQFDIGERAVMTSPFAAHIRNFVLPAGTPDGSFVWLAFLNSPEVLLFSTADRSVRQVARSLSYEWVRIPEDFLPSAAPPRPGQPNLPPFDVVTFGATTDAAGRVYLLTALESSRAHQGRPQRMGVDVLTAADATVRRFEVAGHFTHIAVAPDGSRIYLLDSGVGTLQIFAGPQ